MTLPDILKFKEELQGDWIASEEYKTLKLRLDEIQKTKDILCAKQFWELAKFTIKDMYFVLEYLPSQWDLRNYEKREHLKEILTEARIIRFRNLLKKANGEE